METGLDSIIEKLSEKYKDEIMELGVKFSETAEDIGDTVVLVYYWKERECSINNPEIIIHSSAVSDPHLEIAICHELGHLWVARNTRDRRIIDPQNTNEKIETEICADRMAERIFKGNNAKKEIGRFLRAEIREVKKQPRHGTPYLDRLIILLARLKEFAAT